MKNSRKRGSAASSEKSKLDLKQVEDVLLKNPELMVGAMILGFVILSARQANPKWLKGLAPINPKKAGPWRGKGSFGHGFGPNRVSHK